MSAISMDLEHVKEKPKPQCTLFAAKCFDCKALNSTWARIPEFVCGHDD